MNSVVYVLLVSFATLVVGLEDTPSYLKAVSSIQFTGTRNPADDFAIVVNFLNTCPLALQLATVCLAENNHNPDPIGEAEICRMAIIELNCLDSSIAPTTCSGRQAAIDAVGRLRVVIEASCSPSESASTFVVASFATVVSMACVKLLQ